MGKSQSKSQPYASSFRPQCSTFRGTQNTAGNQYQCDDDDDDNWRSGFSYASSYQCYADKYKEELRKHLPLLSHLEEALLSFANNINDRNSRYTLANCCSQVSKRLSAVLRSYKVPSDDVETINEVMHMCNTLEGIVRNNIRDRMISEWLSEGIALKNVARAAAADVNHALQLLRYSVVTGWQRACKFFRKLGNGFMQVMAVARPILGAVNLGLNLATNIMALT